MPPGAEPAPPRVTIHAVFYDGIRLPHDGGAVLPLGRRNIEIRYRAPGFGPADSLRYAFRMDGLEKAWAEVGARAIAYYRDMEPGTYTFQVRAAHPDGVWGAPAELTVVIERYVYEEPWFLALCLLALAGLAGAGYRWKLRQVRAREVTLERLVDERTRALTTEKERAEGALERAERERAAAQEAYAVVEEQSLQLLRMDRAKSRLFTNISHEFRTPLTLILDPLERAMAWAFQPLTEDAQRALATAHQNALRLLHLINQLLDLAKLEAGNMELRARQQDLVAVVRDATDAFASQAERARVALRFRAPVPQLRAYVDREKVEQVVYNLVSNALKATSAGGKVIVSVRPVGDPATDAEITVRDTGGGIAEDELPFVFDRFYQAETGRLRGGTGIGLALVRELVELHRGHVRVESELDFGSTFIVRLPLGREHLADPEPEPEPERQPERAAAAHPAGLGAEPPRPSAAPDAARPPDAEPTPDRPLVLVVEDHPDLRAAVMDHLRPHYGVVGAADGAEALQLARARRPALVVSDVLMPGVDGLALCRRLKEDASLGDTPVLLLTARASDADRLEALQTGADAFLTKPFSAPELLAQAENLIRTRAAIRERYSGEVLIPSTGQPVVSSEAKFLERVYAVIDEHLGDAAFTVGALSAEAGVSESGLKRRLRALVGMPPVEFIRARRLERAAALLLGRAGTVSEVAAQVGFESPSYFARCFRERYGVAPSAYASDDAGQAEGPTGAEGPV